jgi:hypothetical protein
MPMLAVDGVGAVVWEALAEPYGELRGQISLGADPGLRYPGQWQDELGLEADCVGDVCALPGPLGESYSLLENGARWLRPAWGRYTQSDPVHGKWNLYSYAASNPLKIVDPDGREVEIANRPLKDWPLGYHAFIIITPTGKNRDLLRERMDDSCQIILSGMPGFVHGLEGAPRESLVKVENYDKVSEALERFTVDPPAGQTMEQFELNVLRAFDAYIDGTERYDQFDTPGSGKNSNAFAYGLLIAAGVGKGDLPSKWDLTGWNPGWGDPVEITIDATDN